MRPAELWARYCMGPSTRDVGGMVVVVVETATETGAAGVETAGMAAVTSALVVVVPFSDDGPAVSSSATGEQVSGRAACGTFCCPPPLMLPPPPPVPSRLHSRLEPLRSSFSEELVMVADGETERQRDTNTVSTLLTGTRCTKPSLTTAKTHCGFQWCKPD